MLLNHELGAVYIIVLLVIRSYQTYLDTIKLNELTMPNPLLLNGFIWKKSTGMINC